jgi:uncharacterized membrane protein YkoI
MAWGYLGLAAQPEAAADVDAFGSAKLSLLQAIEAVRKGGAARIAEIGFKHEGQFAGFIVGVAGPGGVHYLRVNGTTGAVSKSNQQTLTRAKLDAQGKRVLAAIGSARFDLAQAVAAAEHSTGGKAISAGMEQLAGIPQYYVQTVGAGKLQALAVDPTTGQAIAPVAE